MKEPTAMPCDAPSRSIDRHLADGCCICYDGLLDSDDGSQLLATCPKCFKSFHFSCVLDLRTNKCPMCNQEVFEHPPSRHRNQLVEEVEKNAEAKANKRIADAEKRFADETKRLADQQDRFLDEQKKIDERAEQLRVRVDQHQLIIEKNRIAAEQNRVDKQVLEQNRIVIANHLKTVQDLEDKLRSKDRECRNLQLWRDHWWEQCEQLRGLRWSEPKWWNGYHTRRY